MNSDVTATSSTLPGVGSTREDGFPDKPQQTDAKIKKGAMGPASLVAASLVLFVNLIEIPFEQTATGGPVELGALLTSEAISVAIVVCMARGSRVARIAFTLLCSASAFAILPSLPAEFATFRIGFYLSLLECLVKVVALILICIGV